MATHRPSPQHRPTQSDVARLAGVSRALVSLVMRGSEQVAPQTRERVLRAASSLGYRPNALARSLASKENRTLGVLISNIANPYFASVYTALAGAAEKLGYHLLVSLNTHDAAGEKSHVETLLEHQVAGIVLISPTSTQLQIEKMCALIPTVVIGRRIEAQNIDVVCSDEYQAATNVVRHLTDLGHKDIVHISGGADPSAKIRTEAFRRAMHEAGIRPRIAVSSFELGGAAAATELLDSPIRPTAIACANDVIAVGALGVFTEAGVSVPEQLSVVGFDDSPLARLQILQLTSVRQPVESFAAEALELLLRRIENPSAPAKMSLLATTLITRRSTGTITEPVADIEGMKKTTGS